MIEHHFNPRASRNSSEIKCQYKQLLVWLLQSDQPRSIDLAIAMARRRSVCPSGSEACPIRQDDLQKAMIQTLDSRLGTKVSLTAVSWFPCEPRIPVGRLSDFDLARFIASRRRALQRTFPHIYAYGTVNVSLLVDMNEQMSWVPEVRLVMAVNNTKCFRDYFRMHCRANSSVIRPLRARTLTDDNCAEHLVGVTYSVPELKTRAIDHAGQLGTTVQSLTGEAAVEAALFCDRFPPSRRIILRCFRRVGGHGRFSLRRSN